jgi:hypothetical protein
MTPENQKPRCLTCDGKGIVSTHRSDAAVCPSCEGSGESVVAPIGVASSERVVPLALEATRAAAEWEPFTQNHDPQYWKALREAYMQGYISGSHAEEKRHNDGDEP